MPLTALMNVEQLVRVLTFIGIWSKMISSVIVCNCKYIMFIRQRGIGNEYFFEKNMGRGRYRRR